MTHSTSCERVHLQHPISPDTENMVYDCMEKSQVLEELANYENRNRFKLFLSKCEDIMHVEELSDLVGDGMSFCDFLRLRTDAGVWWLDVDNPTQDEVNTICRTFNVHPLARDDILTQEAGEKVDMFCSHYFVCIRTFHMSPKSQHLEPIKIYIVVFRDGVLSFSFSRNPHTTNVREPISKLPAHVALASDWICYAIV
jgi:magnesium transporter